MVMVFTVVRPAVSRPVHAAFTRLSTGSGSLLDAGARPMLMRTHTITWAFAMASARWRRPGCPSSGARRPPPDLHRDQPQPRVLVDRLAGQLTQLTAEFALRGQQLLAACRSSSCHWTLPITSNASARRRARVVLTRMLRDRPSHSERRR